MSKPVIMAATAVILAAVVGVAFFRMVNRPWLVGGWTSISCEEMGTAEKYYIKREFHFTTTSIFTRMTHFYTDKNCLSPFVTATFSGEYTSLGPDYVSLRTSVMELKAESSAVAQVLSQNHCGNGEWDINTTQDVSEKGCLDLADVNLMTTEQNYQVTKNDDRVFLGDQKNPLMRTSD